MKAFDRKTHWENIYETKKIDEVSWYQPVPTTSLYFVKHFNLHKSAKIIDIGGGDSLFVDHLLDLGYNDITVLDISSAAIERAKKRVGNSGENVKWIVADVVDFNPVEKYDLWHDRAAFHFLTDETEIEKYILAIKNSLTPNGKLVLGTFSEKGPKKCSGIEIKQYSDTTLTSRSKEHFEKLECFFVDHITPAGANQNFIFCSFRKL